MKRSTRWCQTLTAAALVGMHAASAFALETTAPVEVKPAPPIEIRVLPPVGSQAAPAADETAAAMDPAVRAVLVALTASILREAATSPDPMATLGDSIERKLSFALERPETMRLVEALLAQAFKDVPEELKEPLALFASSMLHSARRDLLQSRRPRAHAVE